MKDFASQFKDDLKMGLASPVPAHHTAPGEQAAAQCTL